MTLLGAESGRGSMIAVCIRSISVGVENKKSLPDWRARGMHKCSRQSLTKDSLVPSNLSWAEAQGLSFPATIKINYMFPSD
eukprot:6405107-Pyramimonas_sp.AAC.1